MTMSAYSRDNDLIEGIKLTRKQRDCMLFMLSHQQGVANWSEPGTGKSFMTMSAMNKIAMAGKLRLVLIVAPATMVMEWESMLREYSSVDWNVVPLRGTKAKKLKLLRSIETVSAAPTIIVSSYDTIPPLIESIRGKRFDLMICDESHFIKNHKTRRFKSIKSINSERVWCLSGTPTPNTPLDAWSQYNLMSPTLFPPSYYAFRARYANIYNGAGFPKIISWLNQEELASKMQSISCRIRKSESGLPRKINKVVELEMPSKVRKVYDMLVRHWVAEIEESGEMIATNNALTKLLRLQQLTSGIAATDQGTDRLDDTKIRAVMERIECLPNDERVIIWSRFRQEVDDVLKALSKTNRKIVSLTGSTPRMERFNAIKQFNETPGAVFVGTIQAGGTGINLQTARYAIYMSHTFNLGDRLQSEDRIHRMKQNRDCIYYDLIMKRSVDEYIKKICSNKLRMAAKLTGDDLINIAKGG